MPTETKMAPGQTEEVIYVDLPPDFEISEGALKHLKNARKLIASPYGWTKHAYTKYRSDGKQSFCVVGALNAALDKSNNDNYDDDYDYDEKWAAHAEAIAAFSRLIGGGKEEDIYSKEEDIYVWNDDSKRRKPHVLAAFEELIAHGLNTEDC